MANDFSGDSNCVALWKFDNNANDSKGGNDLTPVNSPSYDNSDKKEGTYCLDLELSSTQYGTIADGDLDAGFPGKNGTSAQSLSICAWIKRESYVSRAGIVEKLLPGSNQRSFAVYLSGNGLYFGIGYNGGASFSYIRFDTNLDTGKWYHIAATYDVSDDSMKVRVWDDDAGALLDSNKTGSAGGAMSPDVAPLEIGRDQGNDSYVFDGKTDEVVFFKDVLSDAEIDQIRAGTYGAGATEKNSADTGAGADAKASDNPAATLEKAETGSGSDILSQAQAILEGAESGGGVDAVESLQTPQAKTSTDVGTGAEGTTNVNAILDGSESGAGIEALIARLLAGEESGSAVETSSLDTGGGIEELFADESGEGADRLVASIEMPTKGGGMKLWT